MGQEEIRVYSVLFDGKNECNVPIYSSLNIGFSTAHLKNKALCYLHKWRLWHNDKDNLHETEITNIRWVSCL